jgi:hypothetical protein
MASRGRGARAKGANFERALAKQMSEDLGIPAERGLAQTRRGGAEVADVEMDYFHVEAKRHKSASIKAALIQAIGDCNEKDKLPVAITRDDRKPMLVTMLYDDWIKLALAYVKEQ